MCLRETDISHNIEVMYTSRNAFFNLGHILHETAHSVNSKYSTNSIILDFIKGEKNYSRTELKEKNTRGHTNNFLKISTCIVK